MDPEPVPNILSPSGEVMFKPWAGPQQRFWDYRGRYGFIGGSGFTGKTDLLRWYPGQQIAEDDARIKAGTITQSFGLALYARREMPLLREVMERCERSFPKAWPEVKWKAQEKTYVWPNGYRFVFGHMEHEDDWKKYQGWQITCFLGDELPTFVKVQWDMIDTWVRQPAGSMLTPILRAGGNPIGIGRPWVKKFFVDAGLHGKEIVKTVKVEVEDEDGTRRKESVTRGRIFIPATVFDNKSIDQAAYLASFDDKAANITRALRDGDWEVATGDLIGQSWDEAIHVVKPFPIPFSKRERFRACHFSYAASTVIWIATDYDGNFTVYRDLRLTNHTADMVAERTRELEEAADEWQFERERGSKLVGVLGPKTAWPTIGQRGPSAAETMRRVGVYWRTADDNLGAAVDQIRMRLIRRTLDKDAPKKDPGTPGLRYFSTCLASLETVPSMPSDKADPDLPEPKAESSAYRALCYAAMSRPMIPEKVKPRDDDWDTAPKPKRSRTSRTGYPGGW